MCKYGLWFMYANRLVAVVVAALVAALVAVARACPRISAPPRLCIGRACRCALAGGEGLGRHAVGAATGGVRKKQRRWREGSNVGRMRLHPVQTARSSSRRVW